MAIRITERVEQPYGEFGQRLVVQMRLHDWTIDDVANAGEVNRGQVSRWLSPDPKKYQEPKLPTIRRLAEGLGLPIEDLTGRSSEPQFTSEEREWVLILRGTPPEYRPRLRKITIEVAGMVGGSTTPPGNGQPSRHSATRKRAAGHKANGSPEGLSDWLLGQSLSLRRGA